MNTLFLTLTKIASLVDGSNIDLPNQTIDQGSGSSLSTTIVNILAVVFALAGVITVLIITIAGFQYVLSGGDSQKTAKAKNTILYALIGLVVAISAFAIVNFVFDKTGV